MSKKKQSWESRLNVIRGKNLVGHATPKDINTLFKYIELLEEAMDEADEQDFFGTEGWRHRVLREDD